MPTTLEPRQLLSLSVSKVSDGVGIKSRTREGYPVYTTQKILKDRYDQVVRRKIGVSVCSGCEIGCVYCFTRSFKHFKPLSPVEIIEQVENVEELLLTEQAYDQVKISYKQMGDPLLNPEGVLEALNRLHNRNPDYFHIVSTSAADIETNFFNRLAFMSYNGAPIRLQFSCHTTSDEERQRLSPNYPMMSLAQIAKLTNSWPEGKVTLNFVMLTGYDYNPEVLMKLFDPQKTFIKVNWLDGNRFVSEKGLQDLMNERIQPFVTQLEANGFETRVRQTVDNYL